MALEGEELREECSCPWVIKMEYIQKRPRETRNCTLPSSW